MSFLTGSDPSLQQVDLLSSGQTSLLDDLINRILSGSGGFGFDEDFFQSSFVDPALREFQNRIAPGIQQKFIQAGAGKCSRCSYKSRNRCRRNSSTTPSRFA